MTQSGHGEDPHLPAARQPREGIVLPADGSGPLMPGTTGDQAAPAGGSPWGQPWGPDSSALPPAEAPAPGGTWGSGPALPEPSGSWSAQNGAPQQPQDGHPQQSAEGYPRQSADGYPRQSADGYPQQQSYGSYGAGPLPPQVPVPNPYAGPLPPAAPAEQNGGPLPPAQHGAPLPQAGPVEQPGRHGGGAHGGGAHGGPAHAAPGSHAGPAHAAPGSHAGPAHAAPGSHAGPAHGAPGAHAGPAHGAPPAAGDEAATQYIPPVTEASSAGPGALPPERSAESTQRLGRVPGHRRHAQPAPAPAQEPDNQPTQFIAPITGSPSGGPVPGPPPAAPYGVRPGGDADGPAPDRQPPSEFDSLFRTQAEPGDAGATQQLPRFEQQGPAGAPAPGAGYGGTGYSSGGYDDAGGRGAGRRGGRSKGPLIAAVGIGIVVLGVGAGALLSGGGGDDDGDKKPVSATAPAGRKSPAADPAKAQATQLDKVLADSNNSRDTVIRSVADVKSCKNLGQAATDLRNAAKQRDGLVNRLSGLAVDKLPDHEALTSALNDAWKASASADNHYAAWADQVSGKHGCRKGHARNTGEVVAGNKASGDATTAKETAAGLWNEIATKYGLTTRDKSKL